MYSSGADSHHSHQSLFKIKVANLHNNIANNIKAGTHTIYALDYPLIMNNLFDYMQQKKDSKKVMTFKTNEVRPMIFTETKAKLVYEKAKERAKFIFTKSKRKDEKIEDLNL